MARIDNLPKCDITKMKQIGTRTRRTVLKSISMGVVGGLALTGTASAQSNGGLHRELAEVRAATAHYNDPDNAVADGYLPGDHAVCGMGYHYAHEEFAAGMRELGEGNPTPLSEYLESIDRTEPPVLAYGETDDGLVLGAVEYVTFDDSDDLFTESEDDHWHEFAGPLYSLHAWVHTDNPEGIFHPINPREPFVDPDWCEGEDGDH